MTSFEEKYEKELEELELKAGGVFAVPTTAGHKKRWERKKELVRRALSAASNPDEKQRLKQKLDELERLELVLAEKLAASNRSVLPN
jgi:hypothetical protein